MATGSPRFEGLPSRSCHELKSTSKYLSTSVKAARNVGAEHFLLDNNSKFDYYRCLMSLIGNLTY